MGRQVPAGYQLAGRLSRGRGGPYPGLVRPARLLRCHGFELAYPSGGHPLAPGLDRNGPVYLLRHRRLPRLPAPGYPHVPLSPFGPGHGEEKRPGQQHRLCSPVHPFLRPQRPMGHRLSALLWRGDRHRHAGCAPHGTPPLPSGTVRIHFGFHLRPAWNPAPFCLSL